MPVSVKYTTGVWAIFGTAAGRDVHVAGLAAGLESKGRALDTLAWTAVLIESKIRSLQQCRGGR